MDNTQINRDIAKAARRAIAERVFPGCVIGYVTKSGQRAVLPFGNFTYDEGATVVSEDTIYDTASITKTLATASLSLMLIDQGKLSVKHRLIDYIPEFNNSDRERVLIRHLLTFCIEGYGLSSLKLRSVDELFHTLMTHDFPKPPGTTFAYSNTPAALLGLVIERITGKKLASLADAYFYKPLRMDRTTFFPENFPLAKIVPTEIDDWRGLVQGVVHDESAHIAKKEGVIVGHAGLFSTVPDILNFLEMMLRGGEIGARRYFSTDIMNSMMTNQTPEFAESVGLGWELNRRNYMGKFATEHTFGKGGFTGTVCVGDMEREIGYVVLSNRTYPMRPKSSDAMYKFRAQIGDIILGSKQ